MDKGESSFIFADRGLPLAVKGGVDEGELPGGRGLARQDAVLATVEVKILGLVRDLMDSREPEPMEKSMWLRKECWAAVEANGDRARVARADLEIDIADRRIESAGVGVGNIGRMGGTTPRGVGGG